MQKSGVPQASDVRSGKAAGVAGWRQTEPVLALHTGLAAGERFSAVLPF